MSGDVKPIYCIVRGSGMFPEMKADAEAMAELPQGNRVVVTVKTPRNHARLRAYWAMLRDVVNATECAPTPDALHQLIKMETGFVDTIRDAKGRPYAVPASIALDKMDEATFVKFMANAERWIAESLGVDIAELRKATS